MDRVAKTPTATGSGLNSHRESKLNRNLIALFLLGAVTACAHADWKLVATGGPDVRYESGICYDSSRGVTVMFGGSNFGGLLNDTWEWNGTQWTQTATTGPVPGPRSMAYFAYDSDRKVTLMYGGYGSGINGAMNAETWEYSGTKWTQMNVQGPSGRQGGGMAYDPIHHVMVLFGGSVARDGSGIVNQTWTWNGTQWTLASTTGPSARYNFSMAYDSMRQRVVLFGGSDANQNELGDTWEWNGAQWIQTSDQDILPRAEFGIVYDSGMNRTVMFGGLIGSESGPTLAGMETWDGNTWRSVQTQQSGVPAMQNPGLSYDSKRDRIVMFGGEKSNGNYDFVNTTWEWVPEPVPLTLHLPSLVGGKQGVGTVVLTGPAGADGTVVNFSCTKGSVTVTSFIRIPAGQSQGTFTYQAPKSLSAVSTVQVTATVNNASAVGILRIIG